MFQSVTQAPKEAERLDAGMHSMMSRGDWKSLYNDSDDGFKSKTDETKFDVFMNAVSKKLGTPVSSKQTSWRINSTTSGTYIYSDCETVFSKNVTGTEAFIWRKSGDQYRLYGYRINSDDLITR